MPATGKPDHTGWNQWLNSCREQIQNLQSNLADSRRTGVAILSLDIALKHIETARSKLALVWFQDHQKGVEGTPQENPYDRSIK